MKKIEQFWKIRSANYDKLFWTKDASYLEAIIRCAKFDKNDLALDVGCGTGAVANAIKSHVRHVIGIDISDDMLEKGQWSGVSLVKCNISEHIFADNMFDKITARMVFHHILDNLDHAFARCHDLLKCGGSLIVAEGVPPNNDNDVVQWFTDMFALKEERRTFRSNDIADYMNRNGFVNIEQVEHVMGNFSVSNWIVNSGLDKTTQTKILNMHRDAPDKVKKLYEMKFTDNDCLITTKNIIVTGDRSKN